MVLGNNGSGKSTFLRCISLALIGPREIQAARLQWRTWLPPKISLGTVRIDLERDQRFDQFSRKGRRGATPTLSAGVTLTLVEDSSVELAEAAGEPAEAASSPGTKPLSPDRHIWGTGSGWFSAAYGPFRRFAGGDPGAERTYHSNPTVGAHISVFGENAALSEGLEWLRELNYRRLEASEDETNLLLSLKTFVNQTGFLPHEVQFKDVSSRGVDFEDANGNVVSVEDLSDGYRSLLSMTFELIRQLVEVFPSNTIFDRDNTTIISPGVVLIDEVDAHLHPTWQKEIGFWLIKHFPNIQFVVTTHSPLVCHAAVSGSIFQLPNPGTEDKGRFVEGAELKKLLYGDILEGLSTSAFDLPETRSDQSHNMQIKLAELNVKSVGGQLSEDENRERQELRDDLSFPLPVMERECDQDS